MHHSGHIHVHQFTPEGEVVDAEALEQFEQQWATYGKLIEENALAHREVTALLHDHLAEEFASPFTFLDVACGDASIMPEALRGLPVKHYHGIDLSQPALELAAENLRKLSCEIDLDHRDFFEAITSREEHVDAAWCSLSIHHLTTEQKFEVFKAIREELGPGGMFLAYEPTRRDGESREAYVERFKETNQPLWRCLSEEEWDQLFHHVSTCDFPETVSDWREMGRQAGFATSRLLFQDPTDLYYLYRFDV